MANASKIGIPVLARQLPSVLRVQLKYLKAALRACLLSLFGTFLIFFTVIPSAAAATSIDGVEQGQRSIGSNVLQRYIRWGDRTTEAVSIDSNGFFIINGVKRRLIGFCDPQQYSAGCEWNTTTEAVLRKELDYLQSKGVRLYEIAMAPPLNDSQYNTILQLLYDHKMLVVPLFCLQGAPNFDSLATTNFLVNSVTAGSCFAQFLTHVNAFPNVVSIIIENEMDISYGHTYSLANATAYMNMFCNYARVRTTLPILTKFGCLNYSSFATSVQNAFLHYSAVPCFDIYSASSADFTAACSAIHNWVLSKSRNSQTWLTEANYAQRSAAGIDANKLTKAMIDAMLTHNVSVVFLFGVQYCSVPNAMFFDPSGNPIANVDTLLANIPAWQAPTR
jgi:hypothetical protein